MTAFFRGASYLIEGYKMLSHPSLRLWVVLPFMGNLVTMALLLSGLWTQVAAIEAWLTDFLPAMLAWLTWLILPLLFILLLWAFSFFFIMLLNLFASPLLSILAEKTNQILASTEIAPPTSWQHMLIEPLKRQGQKWLYAVPRLGGVALLMMLPIVGQTIGPVMWFCLTSWLLAVEYGDYFFENQQQNFAATRAAIQKNRWLHFGFGCATMVMLLIPFVNCLIMPAAVCGATKLWYDTTKKAN
ncbi:MAG: sulfate transporter CysZ [Shewanellaceae bacterium]|nr:sulfate transporter CysZ [Shewanellaceae bacterium]